MVTDDRKYRQLTRPETYAICQALDQHTHEVADGVVAYAGGWDDKRIAELIIPDFPGNATETVKRLRQKVFGHLPKHPTGSLLDEARLGALERGLRRLCGMLGVDADAVMAAAPEDLTSRPVPPHGSGP